MMRLYTEQCITLVGVYIYYLIIAGLTQAAVEHWMEFSTLRSITQLAVVRSYFSLIMLRICNRGLLTVLERRLPSSTILLLLRITRSRISKAVTLILSLTNSKLLPPNTPYNEVVESFLWFADSSHPNISNAASTVTNYYREHSIAPWKACMKILRYYTPQKVRSSLQNVGLLSGYFSSK